jgi:flagellar assembly factor FliW
MLIETTRFGKIEVDADRVLTFREGLLGFAAYKRYAMIQTGVDPAFYWLQCLDEPALAFIVCDPALFLADYSPALREDDSAFLQVKDSADCQYLVIVNKVDGYLTANLLGPLAIGVTSKLGKQLVLSDRRYRTRHKLMPMPRRQPVARTA